MAEEKDVEKLVNNIIFYGVIFIFIAIAVSIFCWFKFKYKKKTSSKKQSGSTL